MERKQHKFSKHSRGSKDSSHLRSDSIVSSITKKEKKSAADTASSILEELGVKKSSTKKSERNKYLNTQTKNTKKKDNNLEFGEKGISILSDLKKEKKEILNKSTGSTNNKKTLINRDHKGIEEKSINNKNKNEKIDENLTDNFGIHEKFIFFILFCLVGVSFLAYIGGYIKIELSLFRQILRGNSYQLDFVGEFKARQVENGYNRIPLFVVEGTIRNSFYKSDNIEKVKLKAFAFDHEQRLIDSHYLYAGIVLSDNQLENISPINIKTIRQSGDLSILDSFSEKELGSLNLEKKTMNGKDLPFQVVFFKDVSTIKSTSIEIVSYIRNENLVFLGNNNRN